MPVTINGTSGVTTPGLASTTMPTSGGDPVVESGSNSDGEWIRWSEGAQICYMSAPAGPSSGAHEFVMPLPATLVSAAHCASSLTRSNNSNIIAHTTNTPSDIIAGQQVKLWIASSFFHVPSVIVVGRWK